MYISLLFVLAFQFQVAIGISAQDEKQNKSDENKMAEQIVAELNTALRKNDHQAVEKLVTSLLEIKPKMASGYYHRGRARFCMGKIKECCEDFDQYIKLEPSASNRQWERGIALYYAKRFKEGAQQFEEYQTYHDNDVENSTWRFLCVAKTEGIKKAQDTLLKIKNDRRIPMMKIYAMYQGKAKPADVMAEATKEKAGGEKLDDASLNRRKFYAHLYIGLYHEATGKKELAKKHILLARKHKIDHYMWDVANIHANLSGESKRPLSKQAK